MLQPWRTSEIPPQSSRLGDHIWNGVRGLSHSLRRRGGSITPIEKPSSEMPLKKQLLLKKYSSQNSVPGRSRSSWRPAKVCGKQRHRSKLTVRTSTSICTLVLTIRVNMRRTKRLADRPCSAAIERLHSPFCFLTGSTLLPLIQASQD